MMRHMVLSHVFLNSAAHCKIYSGENSNIGNSYSQLLLGVILCSNSDHLGLPQMNLPSRCLDQYLQDLAGVPSNRGKQPALK